VFLWYGIAFLALKRIVLLDSFLAIYLSSFFLLLFSDLFGDAVFLSSGELKRSYCFGAEYLIK